MSHKSFPNVKKSAVQGQHSFAHGEDEMNVLLHVLRDALKCYIELQSGEIIHERNVKCLYDEFGKKW